MTPLIKAEAAAELLSMSVAWVRKAAASGVLPHVRVGHSLRFDVESLRAWVLQQAHGGDL